MHWVSFSTPLRDTQKHPVIMTQVGSQLMQAHSHRDRSRIHPNDSVVWENGTSFTKEKEKKKKLNYFSGTALCVRMHILFSVEQKLYSDSPCWYTNWAKQTSQLRKLPPYRRVWASLDESVSPCFVMLSMQKVTVQVQPLQHEIKIWTGLSIQYMV